MLKGKAWKYGNDINTDFIIPGRYMELTDPEEMAKHAMEGIDKKFVTRVEKGDFIIGGSNFGCGSSREHAPLALKYAGISCVLAEGYARIFYRNAVNIGLPALECPGISEVVETGDELEVDLHEGYLYNRTRGTKIKFTPLPPFMLEVLNAGGLVPYLSKVDEW
jgi:3-isopropylmalate/(R)-2-methylmalate dehydratase small subunit